MPPAEITHRVIIPVNIPLKQPTVTCCLNDTAEVCDMVGRGLSMENKGIEYLTCCIRMAPMVSLYLSADVAQLGGLKCYVIAIPRSPQAFHIVCIVLPQPFPETFKPYRTFIVKLIFEVVHTFLGKTSRHMDATEML